MGLLDDAIREHLELKRRRGADPAEIARAEQEALGPVRREREPAPPTAEEHHDEPHEGAARHADEPAAAQPPLADDDRTRVVPPTPRDADAAHREPTSASPADHDPAPEPAHHARLHEPLPSHAPRAAEPHAPDADAHAAAPSAPAAHRWRDHAPHPGGQDHPAGPQPERPAAPDPRQSAIVDQPTTEYRVEDHDELFAEPRRDEPVLADAHDEPHTSPHEDLLEETPDFLQETPEHDRLWFEQRPPRDFDFDD